MTFDESIQAELDIELRLIEIEKARMDLEERREHHRRVEDK